MAAAALATYAAREIARGAADQVAFIGSSSAKRAKVALTDALRGDDRIVSRERRLPPPAAKKGRYSYDDSLRGRKRAVLRNQLLKKRTKKGSKGKKKDAWRRSSKSGRWSKVNK